MRLARLTCIEMKKKKRITILFVLFYVFVWIYVFVIDPVSIEYAGGSLFANVLCFTTLLFLILLQWINYLPRKFCVAINIIYIILNSFAILNRYLPDLSALKVIRMLFILPIMLFYPIVHCMVQIFPAMKLCQYVTQLIISAILLIRVVHTTDNDADD